MGIRDIIYSASFAFMLCIMGFGGIIIFLLIICRDLGISPIPFLIIISIIIGAIIWKIVSNLTPSKKKKNESKEE